jgi:hypothetical protein
MRQQVFNVQIVLIAAVEWGWSELMRPIANRADFWHQ